MSLDLTRVRALCFDLDGTLSDTDDQFILRLAGWISSIPFLDRRRDPRPFLRKLVMTAQNPGSLIYGLPDRLGIDGPLNRLGDQINQMGLFRHSTPFLLISGVREMLAGLQGYYPLSIVSARGERSTRSFLQQFDLERYFQLVATAQTCRYTKPYPDQIYWVAKKLKISPTACLMIGDTPVDIRAGRAAGAQTVAVLCGFGREVDLRRMEPDLILPTTADLVSVLRPEINSS